MLALEDPIQEVTHLLNRTAPKGLAIAAASAVEIWLKAHEITATRNRMQSLHKVMQNMKLALYLRLNVPTTVQQLMSNRGRARQRYLLSFAAGIPTEAHMRELESSHDLPDLRTVVECYDSLKYFQRVITENTCVSLLINL